MRNILVIDDDVSIGQMLAQYLSQHEFNVSFVGDSVEMARHLANDTPDLLIVDMNLDNEDGMDIVRRITGQIDLPIIIISGERLDEIDKVTGLELGARDYIAKPFSMREMLARVRAALRVKSQRDASSSWVYRFDHWRLSTRHRRLCNPVGEEVKLTASEFNLLIALLRAPGQVLSREQLLLATRIYDQEIFDRSIDVLILRLRRKLGQSGDGRQYVKTQRGAGYLIDCMVQAEEVKRPFHHGRHGSV